jgi:uncharacterized RDD family membrane protein YckC
VRNGLKLVVLPLKNAKASVAGIGRSKNLRISLWITAQKNKIMENQPPRYAGFWLRFIAYFIDSLVISFIEFIIVLPILGVLGFNVSIFTTLSELQDGNLEYALPIIASALTGLLLTVLLITWFYYALLESGPRQATVGKMVLNIVVTDGEGNRMSFARASLRYFSKMLSSLFLMIGYTMAGFTPKKQALHDIIANTYVVAK